MTTTNISSSSLPRWDLSRFGFDSPFDKKLDEQLEQVKQQAKTFKETYEGNIASKSLLRAVTEFEESAVQRAMISSYLSLSYDVALDDDALKKRKGAISQVQSEITGDYLEWFELDLAELTNEEIDQKYAQEPDLVKYKAFLDELRRQRPHNLDKTVERALTVRAPYSGTRPLVSFFDKELSLMRFQLGEETVNMEVLLSRMGSSKDATVRASCLKALNNGLAGAVTRTAALSLSSVAGSWLIENKERKYVNLRSRRNLDNNCPDQVVDSLLNGVRSAGVPLCKRYYAMKKQILKQTQGLETFRWSDRNAPIEISKAEEGKITWEAAVQMVERGYRKFSPKMSELFMDMVNEKRIDVPATDGKKGGAYCAGVVPGVGPYQLLNFDG
jgi:oligoendopeptidase F